MNAGVLQVDRISYFDMVTHTELVCMTGPGVSANSALGRAVGLASRASPLVLLPDWVRMPSNSAQHWVRYTFFTAISTWAAVFLYRSPSLSPFSTGLGATSHPKAMSRIWLTVFFAKLPVAPAQKVQFLLKR